MSPLGCAGAAVLMAVAGGARATAATTAAPDRAEILAAAQSLFDTLKAGDLAAMRALFLPDAILTVQRYGPDGKMTQTRTPIAEWIKTPREPGRFVERMWSPTVLQRGAMAVVWAPYDFHVDGKRTHCGIDSFDFVRTDAGWKFAHLMWTVEPDACVALKAP